MSPQRIQLRRTKGWRKPEGAIVVARPSRWGNPYVVERARSVERDQQGMPIRSTLGRNGPWTVYATRRGHHTGSEWGGFGDDREAAIAFAVELHRRSVLAMADGVDGPIDLHSFVGELAGHDLACWCPEGQPCHADVLLELANRGDR